MPHEQVVVLRWKTLCQLRGVVPVASSGAGGRKGVTSRYPVAMESGHSPALSPSVRSNGVAVDLLDVAARLMSPWPR